MPSFPVPVEASAALPPVPVPSRDLENLKSAFLTSLNHEIRTPLSGILGMTDLLLETSLDEEQKEYAHTAKLCAENLLQILNATLEYSALESGQVHLDHAEFSLKELLDSVMGQQAAKAEAKGLRLFSTLDASLPETFVGDPGRIREMLSHLLDNAIKFTPKGSVELRLSAPPAEDRNRVLTIGVRDTGIGIPPSQVGEIFKSFHQLDQGLSREYAGLGLGLALVRKLLLLMGGEITVESALGEGSAFTITLPLEVPASPAADAKAETEPSIAILAVDDNPVGMTVLKHALHRHGLNVDAATSGQAAIEMAGLRQYGMILMDLQMPGIDGLEATAAIRRISGYEDVPILALTADFSDQTRQHCLQHGMQGFISKPVEAGGLWRTIQRFLPVNEQ